MDDVEKCKDYKWSINSGRYTRNVVDKLLLHRFVLNAKSDEVVDHINRDRLDCRKDNLRIVTYSQNGMNKGKQSNNTSDYVGVSWDKNRNKWESHIKINGKKKHLGRFSNKEDAYKTRLKAEEFYFGEYRSIDKDKNTVFKKHGGK